MNIPERPRPSPRTVKAHRAKARRAAYRAKRVADARKRRRRSSNGADDRRDRRPEA